MRLALACLAGLALAASLALGRGRAQDRKPPEPELVASTGPRTPEDERKGFRLPPGFEAQLVAAEPDIHKPMNLAFDDRGRLWVTDTLEYPFPAKHGTKPRDTVKILSDFGDDGRARSITTFADGLNIPIGVLPLSGGSEALVHGIPNIFHLVDADGDGKADRREVYYSQYGFQDTHGMTNAFTWGFDGWIYACHGFSNDSTVRGSDQAAIQMNSGNTYRMKADGSHVEYFTHGQVNPFGLAFDPMGDLYSCDCHSRPIMMLLRGAYYQSFGKPHDGLGYGPEIMTHDHGSTGIAGITYYAADHFPDEYRGTVFIGNVVTSRVNRDRLTKHGSTYLASAVDDFIVSDDPWFRPVDIELGPDGALYIADFYNKIIGHYEVPLTHPARDRERGRIWRIVYRGPDGQGQPRAPRSDWTSASVEELVQDLAHPNLAVRTKATNQLAWRGGEEAAGALRALLASDAPPTARAHGMWALYRLGALDGARLAALARDPEPLVRVHAMRVLAEMPDLDGDRHALALAGLKDDEGVARRAAADALGRHPSAENLRPLLDARQAVPDDDPQLRHTLRMALRDQLRDASAWGRLPSPLSERDARDLADVAPGVPSAEAARFLMDHIRRYPEKGERLAQYVHHIARHGTTETTEALLAFARGDRAGGLGEKASLLRAIQQGTQERGEALGGAARGWASELVRSLIASDRPEEVAAGIDLAGSLKLKELGGPLTALLGDSREAEPRRVAAINALAAIDPEGAVAPIGRALANASEPVTLREAAARALARINQPEARRAVAEALTTAPERLQNAMAHALVEAGREGCEALLDLVSKGKASPLLLQFGGVQIRILNSGIPDAKERLTQLTAGLPPADERARDLLERRRKGFASARADASAGARVFEKTCAVCHQLNGKGARVGPQLDSIGLRGADRLLEDILDPNRNVDQEFRSSTVALADGRVVSGLLLREEGQVLVLADAQGKEVRIPRDTVEERTLSPVSPMPANFADQIPEADFYDLIAYLLTQQPPR